MSRELTPREFSAELAGFARSAFRLELQRSYNEITELEPFQRWLAGDQTDPRIDDPEFAAWCERIARDTAAGKSWQRVRVQDRPPTPYQRWERWCGLWQARAGEDIRYLTYAKARSIGLLPAAGRDDWWLLDESRLLVLGYDVRDGTVASRLLVTDLDAVAQACAWRDLAVQHATVPDEVRDVA